MTVYADILLLVNISMDILALYIVGRVGHKRMSSGRISCAAIIGGLCATLTTLLLDIDGVAGGILTIIIGTGISIVMTRVAYGKYNSVIGLLRDSIMLWGSGALLGGIMSVILSLGEPVIEDSGNSFLPTFAAVAVAAIGIVRIFSSRSSKKSAEVEITAGVDKYSVSGLCDSGSFAVEPMSGLPVVIVKSAALAGITAELHSPDCRLKLRLVPIQGVGGGGMLYGFLPDRITVGGIEVAAVVAIDEGRGTFAEHMAIIPAVLCKKV